MKLLHAMAAGLSAGLMFAMQPMVARMGLPVLGGSPSVWNTTMVFFQAAVLGGYALAHGVTAWLGPRGRWLAWVGLALAAGASLPMRLTEGTAGPGEWRALWWLGRLVMGAGLPALALAMSSPLVQQWFHRSEGRDPYFLYAASNLGSLGALVAYPVWMERWWSLGEQEVAWRWGYWGWLALAAWVGWRGTARVAGVEEARPSREDAEGEPDSGGWRRVVAWMALGAIPASLLQGCTLFLTTDVASVPLLWVVPLGLYLLTFVLAFDVRSRLPVTVARRALPYLVVAVLFSWLVKATQPVGVLVGLHLGLLVAAGVVCHGRLHELRPGPTALTRFYLAMALGGVLGGSFNALAAPWLFAGVYEYPLAMALACGALHRGGDCPGERLGWRDAAPGVLMGGVLLVLGWMATGAFEGREMQRDYALMGAAAVACWTQWQRPIRLAVAVLAVFAAGLGLQARWGGEQVALRNFFGITRVSRDGAGRFHQLMHGNTVHGRQFLDPTRRGEPLTYYHRQGPLGQVFEALRARQRERGLRMGLIGLGVGSIAAYGRPGDSLTFFEIDPAVIRVATDRRWFTYLSDGAAGMPRIVEGDARLRMAAEPDGAADVIVLDAFSSDAIPVHLLTREAFEMYRRKLKPGGWLVVHVSNRYLDLGPVLGALARDTGMVGRLLEDDSPTAPGQEASHWAVLASDEAGLGILAKKAAWHPLEARVDVPAWTDQRASIWPVFRW